MVLKFYYRVMVYSSYATFIKDCSAIDIKVFTNWNKASEFVKNNLLVGRFVTLLRQSHLI